MTAIGIHASHEQIPPSALLTAMCEAEAAGFKVNPQFKADLKRAAGK